MRCAWFWVGCEWLYFFQEVRVFRLKIFRQPFFNNGLDVVFFKKLADFLARSDHSRVLSNVLRGHFE